ncbi:protein mono-ADP-ribosyltransferase PARP10 isoform X3 [Mesoplodon densirostris]|uniref:protein mono-ADP-ribosyltransferase PARP10 isoform X3 n=1 Tax=Mesoplodon densirostris TaxID=48708 RepID=UPI0028DB5FC8|nr:protein mono-ADP-ribosyltransferase PARP10 isoform X3 [Mesoplodon densirostris]
MWASPTVRGVPGNAAQGPARGEAGLWAATPPAPPAQAVMMGEEEAELGAAVELRGLPHDVPDELLTLYFENRRSSGGGPVSSWQRLGRGGILTFQEAADAARVLAQEHTLHGARLSLRPAPPRAPSRLLLQGLPAGTGPQHLEQYVQALLCAAGQPVQPCHALASPRPDRALVQLPKPLSEAEARVLEEHAQALGLEGAEVSLAWVPQARAVRVVGANPPADLMLLELYLENERRSGGGPLEGMRSLPGHLGTIASFRQWQVAERVLQRAHQLQGSELSLVPHYDVLEPEELSERTSGGGCLAELGPAAPKHAVLEAGGPARAQNCTGNVTLGSEEAPGQAGASLRTGPLWDRSSLGQARPVSSSPMGSSEQEGLVSPGPTGSPGPAEIAVGSLEQVVSVSLDPVGSPRQEGLVETVLPMEPGAMRFIQLYHEDLLAGLGDVALFPLEGSDVTGFRLCGALAPCQAAEEFLQSLLGSVSCHLLSLKHPGSARFLLSPDGQHLLRGLEAQFQCVFGTERLARAALDADQGEVDPTEALQALPGYSHTLWPPDNTDGDQENMSLVPQQRPREPLGRLERVAESSSEFQTVVQAFCATLDAAHGRIRVVQLCTESLPELHLHQLLIIHTHWMQFSNSILNVERVLHPLLQQQYELHRERLERCCDRRPAEQVLYHGTSVATVPDICAHGFNRSFCGRNGTLYGQGVYFAKHASLSVLDRYSPPDSEGHKAVFVARVLTGDYGQGRRGLRAPPPRPPGHALLRYDSAVDCLPRPSIFVIFHDTQALPTHLITCKHMSGSPRGDPPGLLSNSSAT